MQALFSHLVFWHWFGLAVILGILDVVLGANFFFVWCGLSAVVVGIIMLIIPLSWEFQFLIFGLGIMTSLIAWRKYVKTHARTSDQPYLNQRAQQYIGRVFTLEEPIIDGRGKVKVDDSVWRVEGKDMPAGSKVQVINVDGVVLKVKKGD